MIVSLLLYRRINGKFLVPEHSFKNSNNTNFLNKSDVVQIV